MRVKLLVGVSLVVVVAGGLFLFIKRAPPETRRLAEAPVGTEVAERPILAPEEVERLTKDRGAEFSSSGGGAGDPLRYRFSAGDILTYALDSSREVTQRSSVSYTENPLDPNAVLSEQSGTTSMNLRIQGNLVLRVYETGDAGFVLGVRLGSPNVSATLPPEVMAAADPEAIAGLQRIGELEKAFSSTEALVEMEPAGRVRQISFPSAATDIVRNGYRGLIVDAQLLFPEMAQPEWTLEERNVTGAFTAAYRAERGRDAQGQPRVRITKRNLGYRSVSGHALAASSNTRVDLVESSDAFSALFDPEAGRITAMTLEGRTHLKMAGETEATSVATVRLVLRDVVRDPSLQKPKGLTAAGLELTGLAEHSVNQRRKRFLKRTQEENLKVERIVERLTELLKDERSGGAQGELFLTTADLFRYDDGQVKVAESVLRAAKGEGSECRFLMDALAAAGTATAQRTISGFAADPKAEEPLRRAALTSASFLTVPPTPELTQAVTTAAQNDASPKVQGEALVTAGMLADQTSGQGDAKTSQSFIDVLRKSRDVHPDASWRILWLVSMGNTRKPEVYPDVEADLAHVDPRVAAQAAETLGYIVDPRVEPRLQQLLTDAATRPMVAVGAVKGLEARRTETARTILQSVSKSHTDDEVRKRAELAAARMHVESSPAGVPVEFSGNKP